MPQPLAKPRLLFFQFRYDERLPPILLAHKREHVKCLEWFFDVTVIDEDGDCLELCDPQHASAVALLPLVVLFRLVADGQGALTQGMRRIGDFTRLGVLGRSWELRLGLLALPRVPASIGRSIARVWCVPLHNSNRKANREKGSGPNT